MATRTIKVDYLARVEGEGALYLEISDGKVNEVRLKIFEPPRFFEALLRGRHASESPDITARICGICPVAYQMGAVHAVEAAAGVTVGGPLRELRRLLMCGEWIESHVLHMAMLHAPDFLGYDGVVSMARDHADVVKMALRLKQIGNRIVQVLGGREIHPINVRLGGFHRTPSPAELRGLAPDLAEGVRDAEALVRWVATLDIPEFERSYELVALDHPDEYPMHEGQMRTSSGMTFAASAFEDHVQEEHVEHSNALHASLRGVGHYLVGPVARYNLSFDRLPDTVRSLAAELGAEPPQLNPFRSILLRGLEVLYAFQEALRIVEGYDRQAPHVLPVKLHAGAGHACVEAPRGTLYHGYDIDDAGLITSARIVPPTSQNQATIEDDLSLYAESAAALTDEELQWRCEQAIRNYDPCISCATHFINLTVVRR